MRIARTIAVVAVTAVAALGLSACGGDDDPKSPGTDATKSSQAVANTSQPAAKDPGDGADGDYATWLAAVREAKTYRFTGTTQVFDDASAEAVGSVDVNDPDKPNITVDVTDDDGITATIIIIKTRMYGKFPQYTGDKYIIADVPDESPADALSESAEDRDDYVLLTKAFDLNTRLASAADAVLSVEKKGDPIMIDGVSAQPYEVTLDAAKAGGEAEEASPTDTDEPATHVYTYYIGPDNLPRRLVYSDSDSAGTMDYTDWGKSVSISAPPASQIADMDSLDDDTDSDS